MGELQLTEQEQRIAEAFERRLAGEDVQVPKLQEFLATPAAKVLMPKIIIGQVRKAAEPLYIGTKMLKKIRMDNAAGIVIFPSIGVLRAHDVAEGQEFPEETLDWQRHEGSQIAIRKVGLRLAFTQEMIQDAQWDIIALHLEAAGRAMARAKEEKVFRQFSMHGHVVFDNALREQYPEAGTTGKAFDGTYNDTMSIEDFLDLVIAVYNNEFNVTDVLMHPLAWVAFAKTALYGGFDYVLQGTQGVAVPRTIQIGPDAVQGRLPFPFTIQLSPFIPFDKERRRFDMYAVDRNNIGVLIQKEDVTIERFDDPSRDIHNVKLRERYGIGILFEGRAIAVARNIALDKSYPDPVRVKQV